MAPLSNNSSMDINNHTVNVTKIDGEDYICLTDMAKSYGATLVIENWLRNKNTLEFLGIWEELNNPDFNYHDFEGIKNAAGLNRFVISVKEWVSQTNAKGIVAKAGRYGGTYAHRDIAFEFGTWLSPHFRLLVITEFQRLKAKEQKIVAWDSRRYLSRVNYRLHTDAIKEHLIPSLSVSVLQQYTYTNEADMLNRLVFGQTAGEWKVTNPELAQGSRNQRDFAASRQLILLANLENLNAHLISEKKPQSERIATLAKEAKRQYTSLLAIKDIEDKSNRKAIGQ